MLDDPKTYSKYDPEDIAFGIEKLSEQVSVAWADTRAMKFPKSYSQVTNVVVVGMGGSSLGAHIVQSACTDRLKVPLHLVRGYTLPSWVGPKTLVLAVTYSGTTEEVLEAIKEAKKKRAKIVSIAVGEDLKKYSDKNNIPGYFFTPGDLSKQPRLGLGFTLTGELGILQRIGLLKITGKDIEAMRKAMGDVLDTCARDVVTKENPAKTVAEELHDKAVFVVGSEHLIGAAHVMSNQINENAKQFCDFWEIPELNHHLMEGLDFPKEFFKKFSVLMIDSKLYHPHVHKRYDITAEIFEKQGGSVIEYQANGKTKLEEVGEILQFGSFLSYYMAMLNKINPIGIPFVDWFKEEMEKR